VSDLEKGRSKPRLAKFYSLSLIYGCDITDMSLFGLNISDLDHERGLIALPYTHLSAGAASRVQPIVPSAMLPAKALLERTNLFPRMFQDCGEVLVTGIAQLIAELHSEVSV